MESMNLKNVNLAKVGGFLREKSPELLTGFGLACEAGAITYAFFAPEPKLVLDEAKRNKRDAEGEDVVELSKWDSAKALLVAYWPSVAMFVLGTVCIIASDCIDDKRQAALSAAYSMASLGMETFKEKAVEKLGEAKVKEIQEEADVELSNRKSKGPSDSDVIYGVDKNCQLCYDSYGGQYFWSDLETIRGTFNELNSRLLEEDFISLNELYIYLGIPTNTMGDDMGWHLGVTGIIKPRYSSKIVEEGPYAGRTCLVICYDIDPRYYHDMY